MRLTKREKNMFIALTGVIFLYGYINFIINPQVLKIKDLKSGMNDYKLIMKEESYSVDTLSDLNNEYEKHLMDVEAYSKNFFTSLEQSTLILLLDKFIDNTELEITGVDFSEYRSEELGNNQLNAISVSVPFRGSYESLLDFLRQIRKNDKKILIKDINILNNGENQVSGNVVLDFYSIPPLGTKKLGNGIIKEDLYLKQNPFAPFEGYVNEFPDYIGDDEIGSQQNYGKDQNISTSNENVVAEDTKKTLLEGFESIDMFFVGNPKEVEGYVNRDTNRKQGNYSLKLQYDFLMQRGNNIANVVFDKVKPLISIQPEYISISIYSYEKSDHRLGFILRDTLGKEYNILLADKVDWTDWNALQAKLPDEITYPAEVQRIYVQSTNQESKTNGIFLLDNMEVAYRNTLFHSFEKDINTTSKGYVEYYVKKGDTIFSISKHFYNDYSKRFLIMEYNNIKDPNQIRLGQRLLIPKS